VVAGVANAVHHDAATDGNRIIVRHAVVIRVGVGVAAPNMGASAPIHAEGGVILWSWKLGGFVRCVNRRGQRDNHARKKEQGCGTAKDVTVNFIFRLHSIFIVANEPWSRLTLREEDQELLGGDA